MHFNRIRRLQKAEPHNLISRSIRRMSLTCRKLPLPILPSITMGLLWLSYHCGHCCNLVLVVIATRHVYNVQQLSHSVKRILTVQSMDLAKPFKKMSAMSCHRYFFRIARIHHVMAQLQSQRGLGSVKASCTVDDPSLQLHIVLIVQ